MLRDRWCVCRDNVGYDQGYASLVSCPSERVNVGKSPRVAALTPNTPRLVSGLPEPRFGVLHTPRSTSAEPEIDFGVGGRYCLKFVSVSTESNRHAIACQDEQGKGSCHLLRVFGIARNGTRPTGRLMTLTFRVSRSAANRRLDLLGADRLPAWFSTFDPARKPGITVHDGFPLGEMALDVGCGTGAK